MAHESVVACMHIHIHSCLFVCALVSKTVFILYSCLRVYLLICLFVWFVSLYLLIFLDVCYIISCTHALYTICMYTHIHICIYVYPTLSHTHINSYIYMYVYIYICTHRWYKVGSWGATRWVITGTQVAWYRVPNATTSRVLCRT